MASFGNPPLTNPTTKKLGDLTDVNVSGATNLQVIAFNTATGMWTPKAEGGGVSRYVDLTDVNVPAPTDGLMTHYDAGTAKFVQASETKVDPTTRNVTFNTAGTFAAISAGDSSLQSTAGQAVVEGQTDATLTSVTGNAVVEATVGDVGLISSANVEVGNPVRLTVDVAGNDMRADATYIPLVPKSLVTKEYVDAAVPGAGALSLKNTYDTVLLTYASAGGSLDPPIGEFSFYDAFGDRTTVIDDVNGELRVQESDANKLLFAKLGFTAVDQILRFRAQGSGTVKADTVVDLLITGAPNLVGGVYFFDSADFALAGQVGTLVPGDAYSMTIDNKDPLIPLTAPFAAGQEGDASAVLFKYSGTAVPDQGEWCVVRDSTTTPLLVSDFTAVGGYSNLAIRFNASEDVNGIVPLIDLSGVGQRGTKFAFSTQDPGQSQVIQVGVEGSTSTFVGTGTSPTDYWQVDEPFVDLTGFAVLQTGPTGLSSVGIGRVFAWVRSIPPRVSDLKDVDYSVAATDGQVLVYDATGAPPFGPAWKPGAVSVPQTLPNTSSDGATIYSVSGIAPPSSGEVTFMWKGNPTLDFLSQEPDEVLISKNSAQGTSIGLWLTQRFVKGCRLNFRTANRSGFVIDKVFTATMESITDSGAFFSVIPQVFPAVEIIQPSLWVSGEEIIMDVGNKIGFGNRLAADLITDISNTTPAVNSSVLTYLDAQLPSLTVFPSSGWFHRPKSQFGNCYWTQNTTSERGGADAVTGTAYKFAAVSTTTGLLRLFSHDGIVQTGRLVWDQVPDGMTSAIFEISYSVASSTGNNDRSFEIFVQKNGTTDIDNVFLTGTELIESRTINFNKDAVDKADACAKTFMVTLSSNDYIEIGYRNLAADTAFAARELYLSAKFIDE